MNITLKFPTVQPFTHSDLAQANGKTNQQVWVEYSQMRKEGIIVQAGTRSSGKGKPTLLWRVADGTTVPLVTEKVEVVKVAKVVKTPPPVVVVEDVKPIVVVPEPVVEVVQLMEIKTAAVPPATVVEPLTPAVVQIITEDIQTTDKLCPFCKTPLLAVKRDGSVRLWCNVNDHTVCSCSENPYGVSNNINNAYEILCQKFGHTKA